MIEERLKQLETLDLHHGAHCDFTEGHCALECKNWVKGLPHSDESTDCPVIDAFLRNWNDSLGTDDGSDEKRNRLIRPLLADCIGSKSTPEVEKTRAWMAVDWLARVHAPAFLELSKDLVEHAEALRAMPELKSGLGKTPKPLTAAGAAARAAAWDAARDAARDAAWAAAWDAARDAARAAARAAAWDAAWAAARDAARDAAGAAARAAAWDAARAAARAAAGDAARAAAWDAAGAAAGDALQPTVEKLQASAQDLVRRMLAVK